MIKIIVLLVLSSLNQAYSFSSGLEIKASEFNQRFEEAKDEIQLRGHAVNYTSSQAQEIISSEIMNNNFSNFKSLMPNLSLNVFSSGEVIQANKIEENFNNIDSEIISYYNRKLCPFDNGLAYNYWNNSTQSYDLACVFDSCLADYVINSTGTACVLLEASGGSVTTIGDYKIHTFSSSSNFNILSKSPSASIEYLIIAGGGGGGGRSGGGGGAGGFLSGETSSISVNNYNVVVGTGGNGGSGSGLRGNNGLNSSFNSLIAIGGGGGGSDDNQTGTVGGSGGGGRYGVNGASGTSGQGFAGGFGTATTWNAGGGGGASAKGVDGTSTKCGNGGPGRESSISGSSVTYAGGGGGGSHNPACTRGLGGIGGGGAGGVPGGRNPGVAGTDGLGGGGGGGSTTESSGGAGGRGGHGIVILKYKYR